MKFRHLFVSLLAVAGLLATSCQEEEKDLGLPEVKISQNELSLDQGVGATTLTVYATRDWTVSTTADWISINPQNGKAYTETKVTVTILENTEYNRVGTVKFDIGYDSKTLTINQAGAKGEKSEGSGTVEDPYTVAGVIAFIETLGTETSEQAVYVKGKVQAITLKYGDSGTYGNARFTMVDEGVNDKVFTAYNVLYLGNKKWAAGQDDVKEGDEVIVCGKVYNYGGKTPENASGAFLYSLNGVTAGGGTTEEAKGTGTLEDPYNPAGAAAAVANLTWTSNTEYQTTAEVYVKGVISEISLLYADSGNYGNARFNITEEGGTTSLTCYNILYLGGKKWASGQTDVKVGDEVIVYGKLMNYRGNTPETTTGCYLYSLNGVTGGGDNPGGGDEPKGTGTLEDPYNPAGAVNAVKDLTWTSTTDYQTTDEVYVKGKISKIADKGTFTDGGTYGNASFYITETGEATGTEFYAYRILYLNNKKFASGQTDIKVGDEVVIYGKLMNYCGNTPETATGCYLYSLNGKTEDDGTTGGGGSDDSIFSETFASSQGNFTIDNKNLPSALSAVWTFDATYGMKATAYSNNTNYDSESWLVSPEIDLTSQTTAFLSFDHAGNYFESADKTKEQAILKVTKDNGTTWEAVTIPTYFTSWTFVSSGEISLASYVGNKIKIAFCYSSTATKAGTWEVKNVKVYKTSVGGGTTGGGGETGNGITVTLAATNFTADTDATYGTGFKYTSTDGIVVAYYKHQSNTNPINTNYDHIRVYKGSVIVVSAPAGKTLKKLVFKTTSEDYTKDLTVLEGAGSCTTNSSDVTWTGSAAKFVGHSAAAQNRFSSVVVTLE